MFSALASCARGGALDWRRGEPAPRPPCPPARSSSPHFRDPLLSAGPWDRAAGLAYSHRQSEFAAGLVFGVGGAWSVRRSLTDGGAARVRGGLELRDESRFDRSWPRRLGDGLRQRRTGPPEISHFGPIEVELRGLCLKFPPRGTTRTIELWCNEIGAGMPACGRVLAGPASANREDGNEEPC